MKLKHERAAAMDGESDTMDDGSLLVGWMFFFLRRRHDSGVGRVAGLHCMVS